jgi:hypothetical protein
MALTETTLDNIVDWLRPLNLTVNEWRQIVPINRRGIEVLTFRAPDRARLVQNFSLAAATWLTRAERVVFCVNDATVLDRIERQRFTGLIFGPNGSSRKTNIPRQLFLENAAEDWERSVIMVGNIIHLALLQDAHMHIVSLGLPRGKCLGIQDGAVDFIGGPQEIADAEKTMDRFFEQPFNLPYFDP